MHVVGGFANHVGSLEPELVPILEEDSRVIFCNFLRLLFFAASCNLPDASASPQAAENRFYAYGVVGRLALLAASIELEKTDPDQSLYG